MKFVKGQPPETRDSLTKEEVSRLVNFLKEDEEYHIYLPAIVTGLGTGLRCGELLGLIPKKNLPNYSEFYEARHFCPGSSVPETADWEACMARAVAVILPVSAAIAK